MHHPTDRIAHTTAFVTPVVEHWLEREIAQWVHPMKDRSDDPAHHKQTLLPRRYISLPDIRRSFPVRLLMSGADVRRHLQTAKKQPADVCDRICRLEAFLEEGGGLNYPVITDGRGEGVCGSIIHCTFLEG